MVVYSFFFCETVYHPKLGQNFILFLKNNNYLGKLIVKVFKF